MKVRIALGSLLAALACAAPVGAMTLQHEPTPAATPPAQVQPLNGPIAILASRTMPNVVGTRLDRAESALDAKGIGFKTEGGGLFGIVVKRDWGVCDTVPHAGKPIHGVVKLVVGHFSCGA